MSIATPAAAASALFATGLSLQSASRLSAHPGIQPRIEEAVDEIDAAGEEIRQAIDHLHRSVQGVSTGEEEFQALVASYAPGLGYTPALDVDGDIEIVGPGLRPDVLAVVREGLSNVSRHAGAQQATVHLTVDEAWVCVEITDDGVGTDPGLARGVWSTFAERAVAASGSSTCFPADHGGRCCAAAGAAMRPSTGTSVPARVRADAAMLSPVGPLGHTRDPVHSLLSGASALAPAMTVTVCLLDDPRDRPPRFARAAGIHRRPPCRRRVFQGLAQEAARRSH